MSSETTRKGIDKTTIFCSLDYQKNKLKLSLRCVIHFASLNSLFFVVNEMAYIMKLLANNCFHNSVV
jgi:hypothetical protein